METYRNSERMRLSSSERASPLSFSRKIRFEHFETPKVIDQSNSIKKVRKRIFSNPTRTLPRRFFAGEVGGGEKYLEGRGKNAKAGAVQDPKQAGILGGSAERIF